jgi:response regulator RpfG family c-di-GMP phosphodiesterase
VTVQASPEARTWTLLAVDDDPCILVALRRVFRTTSWRILTAGRVQEALVMLASEPVDAVLSDLRMPGRDGLELLERVGRGWPRTARVVLTSQTDAALLIEAINRGRPHGCIAKPWNDDELVTTLYRIAQWHRFDSANHALQRVAQKENDELRALNADLEARAARLATELATLGGRSARDRPTSIASADDASVAMPGRTSTLSSCLRTTDLRPGQILAQDFMSPGGALLLSAGHRLDEDLILRIRAFERQHGLALTLTVRPPSAETR